MLISSQSVELDVVVLAGGASAATLATDPAVAIYVQEAYRHHENYRSLGAGMEALSQFGIPLDAPGVVTAETADTSFTAALTEAAGWHRHWSRPTLLSLAMVR